jgi:branched-chain amino acid aminotransferase
MAEHAAYLWWNGEMKPWSDACVHVTTLGWSTMSAVFEGIKAYWNDQQQELYALQLREHYERFVQSMRLQRMTGTWSVAEFVDVSLELLRANGAKRDTYLRPLAYFGDATWFSTYAESPTHVCISTTPFETMLGSGRMVSACVSSWTRLSDNMMSPRVKCISNYQNSRLALVEAVRHGYDLPILLNDQQKVTEGPAACLFVVRGGVAITPAITSGILESITRKTLLQMCAADLAIPTEEREIDRSELYVAEEIFFCGTGAEIQPVNEIDGYRVGDGRIGPVTRRIEAAYHDMVRGRSAHTHWRSPVYGTIAARA